MTTVVITGVSRGLGAEMFAQLHAAGHRLVGIGRRFTDDQRELARADPERVHLLEADLTEPATLPDRDALAALLTGAESAALVHNAGIVEPIGAVGELPGDQIADTVTVNLTAPMLLTNAFLGALASTATATILFVSSGAAQRPVDGWAVYSTTKRAGEVFFETIAAQVADQPRIRVTSLNPGVMNTGMQAAIRTAAAGPEWFPARDRFVALHADGTLPEPADVARRILQEHLQPAQ